MKLITEWTEVIETAVGEITENQEPVLWLKIYRAQVLEAEDGSKFVTRTKDVEAVTAPTPYQVQKLVGEYFGRPDVRWLRRNDLEQPCRETLSPELLDGTAQIYAPKTYNAGDELPELDGPDETLMGEAQAEMEAGIKTITVELTANTAWAIIGALQLALRHEGFRKRPSASVVRSFVESIGQTVATGPALQELLKRGF